MVALPATALVAPFTPEIRVGETLPALLMRDQANRVIRLGAGSGAVTILSFFYTRCPDPTICSSLTAKFAWMQAHLHRGEPISLVEVTLDPVHDTVDRLARYSATVHADSRTWHMVTGRPTQVTTLVRRIGLRRETKRDGIISHSEAVAILRGDGTLVERYDGTNTNPIDILTEARVAVGASISPLASLRLWISQNASALCGGASGAASAVTVGGILAILIASGITWSCLFGRLFKT